MLRANFWLLLAWLCVGNCWAQTPHTTLFKESNGQWHVRYQSDAPVSELVFVRNPDDSRIHRWKPVDNNFRITRADGIETISRHDTRPFSEVTFELTPTYIHLPKDYAPFSPFSDGGLLMHTGRFFSCATRCGEQNRWPFEMLVPDGETAIVNGLVVSGNTRWVDSNSGMNLYVGPSRPHEGTHFVSVVDQGLPAELKNQLKAHVPELVDYFASHLTLPQTKPMLFASFGETEDGRYGRQGGVLPNQVFMHWYGRSSLKNSSNDDTTFFFAHEIAHLFQGEGMNIEDPTDYWVSEGAAEFMAAKALSDMQFGTAEVLKQKVANARQQCLAGLQGYPDFQSALGADFQLHYSCGMLIHNAVNDGLQKSSLGTDFFDLWHSFNRQISHGKSVSALTYLQVIQPLIDSRLYHSIEQLVQIPGSNMIQILKQL